MDIAHVSFLLILACASCARPPSKLLVCNHPFNVVVASTEWEGWYQESPLLDKESKCMLVDDRNAMQSN